MRTEDLIAALVADTTPLPRPGRRLALGLAGALALSAALFALGWGLRDDVGSVLASALVLKTLVPAGLAVLALALALRLIRPAMAPGGRALALGGGVAAVAAGFALALGREGAAGLAMALHRPDLWVCLTSVPVLAAAPLAAVLWALSAGAPLRPGLAGAVAGLAAGGMGGAIYSLFCTIDMALFVIPAYGAAVLIVMGLGAVLGARLLRW